MKNESGTHLYITAAGRIVAGYGHPEARVLLVAPGGDVTDDWLRKVPGLKDAIRPQVAPPPGPAPEAKMVKAPVETKQIVMPAESKAAEAKAPEPKTESAKPATVQFGGGKPVK